MKRFLKYFAVALLLMLTSCGIFSRTSKATYRKLIPSEIRGVKEQIIERKGYILSYNCDTRLPNWVFWHLTQERANGDAVRPGNAYHEDSKVPKPRATNADYRRSGYTRGHMCPAGDNKWNRTAMYDTFAYSNICPQTERCNSGVWNSIEMMCREWAREYDDIYIVSGPILGKNHETIGSNDVAVPDAFFKVVVCMNGTRRGIGFICDNSERKQTMKQCVVTIEEVERATGIDFFPNLSSRDRRIIEEHANLKDW